MLCGVLSCSLYRTTNNEALVVAYYVLMYCYVSGVANTALVLVKDSKTANDYTADFPKGHSNQHLAAVEFDRTSEEIVGRPGETVSLPCSVKNLGDNVVSWIRRRDLQILTSDMIKFTADKRFHIEHSPEEANNWTLVLNDAQNSDAGFYECQINTEPKVKRAVLLLIYSGNGVGDYSDQEENRDGLPYQIANILGPSERYVHFASTVTLSCFVKINDSGKFPLEESYFSNYRRLVKWLHFSDLLTIESSRGGGGGINIDTRISTTSITSQLTIATVTLKDAGLYTCKPIKGLAGSVTLIIIQNEEIEAMKPENYLQSGVTSGHSGAVLRSIHSAVFSTAVFLFNLQRV